MINKAKFNDPRSMRVECGFSVLELIIVLLIIGLLAVLALPATERQLQYYRLDTSVSALSYKLMEARMTAIKRNRTSWLTIDKVERTVQVRTTDTSGTTINVGFPERLPTGVVLDEANSIDISFDSLGRFLSGTSPFTLTEVNTTRMKDISISPAGKITVGPMY